MIDMKILTIPQWLILVILSQYPMQRRSMCIRDSPTRNGVSAGGPAGMYGADGV